MSTKSLDKCEADNCGRTVVPSTLSRTLINSKTIRCSCWLRCRWRRFCVRRCTVSFMRWSFHWSWLWGRYRCRFRSFRWNHRIRGHRCGWIRFWLIRDLWRGCGWCLCALFATSTLKRGDLIVPILPKYKKPVQILKTRDFKSLPVPYPIQPMQCSIHTSHISWESFFRVDFHHTPIPYHDRRNDAFKLKSCPDLFLPFQDFIRPLQRRGAEGCFIKNGANGGIPRRISILSRGTFSQTTFTGGETDWTLKINQSIINESIINQYSIIDLYWPHLTQRQRCHGLRVDTYFMKNINYDQHSPLPDFNGSWNKMEPILEWFNILIEMKMDNALSIPNSRTFRWGWRFEKGRIWEGIPCQRKLGMDQYSGVGVSQDAYQNTYLGNLAIESFHCEVEIETKT